MKTPAPMLRHPGMCSRTSRSSCRFIPNGIRWVVERLFAWLSRYRRLNTVFDRKADLFVAHVWIAISPLLARRLLRSQGIDLQYV
jgi:transposase